jgi:hypothetical protein
VVAAARRELAADERGSNADQKKHLAPQKGTKGARKEKLCFVLSVPFRGSLVLLSYLRSSAQICGLGVL